MQVADNIHYFPTGPFNWYVIEDKGALTLVDGGFHGHYGRLVKGLRSIGRAVTDVKGIVLTHAHADHMGMIEKARQISGATVFVHEADAQAAQRILQLPWFGLLSRAWIPYMAGMLAHATMAGVFTAPRIRAVHTVKHGELLDIPGNPTVLHLPGHTPGEITLHLPQRKAFISGDALITRNLFTGTHGAPQFAPRALESDGDESRRSLERVLGINDVTMLPGHGKPWHGDLSRMARELAKIESA